MTLRFLVGTLNKLKKMELLLATMSLILRYVNYMLFMLILFSKFFIISCVHDVKREKRVCACQSTRVGIRTQLHEVGELVCSVGFRD